MAIENVRNFKEYDHATRKGTNVSNVVKELSARLADSYMLYIKTQNYHWNVEGPNFYAIHKLTEEHYIDLQDAIDLMAERIRALGYFAPGRFSDFSNFSQIRESQVPPYSESAILQDLTMDHQMVSEKLRESIAACEKEDDQATVDMLTDRLKFHEKALWMLRSMQPRP